MSSTKTKNGRCEVRHPEEKHAPARLPIDDRIRRRWSPRSFADRMVTDKDLMTLFEAARWAPSSFNEQPWRFIVATRDDDQAFDDVLACLSPKNREWAMEAPVLMLTAARTVLAKNGGENRHAYHDVGLAMGNLILQAVTMGLYVHQMGGIDPERARQTFDVPAEFDVVTGVALGFLGDPENLDDPGRRASETSSRSRRPLDDLVFENTWGHAASFVSDFESRRSAGA